MKALYAGLQSGEVLYTPEQNHIGSKDIDGYAPNPSQLWEVGQTFYMNPEFPRKIPDGSLLKILYDGLCHLPQRAWTIVFMHRDPDEIKASCDRVDAHLRAANVRENPKAWLPFDVFRPYNQQDIDHVIGIMEMRADVKLIHIQFADLMANPLETFQALQAEGIPIDPLKCAAVINPDFHRFRGSNEHRQSRDAGPRAQGFNQA
jgi:hypothetical protein